MLDQHYPALAAALPHLPLGHWPSPVTRLASLGHNVFVKHDGYCGESYGGNKLRKLEHLFADARARGCTSVMTYGVAGSNHALATATYAAQLGFDCYNLLTPQTNAHYVAQNLLASLATGAQLVPCANDDEAHQHAARLRRELGAGLYEIPGGGSSPLGTVGFVSAAFELLSQVRAGLLPLPDRIYVALGTMGTAAGISLGLAAAGVDTEVVPVRVVRPDIANSEKFIALFASTNRLLHQLDPGFPLLRPLAPRIRHDQYGQQYAVFTQAGMAAKKRLFDDEQLKLEGTYTGKAMAALLSDLEQQRDDRTILYWHTYNARPLAGAGSDYHELPAPFHRYFETPVQALDRA